VKLVRARNDRILRWRPIFCVSVCVSASLSSQIWEHKSGRFQAPSNGVPKFLHRPKRLPCDSASAGAATQQIAPPTRDPAGRGPTDARHSRHARSRSHQGHRAATVTTESLQAAGKLPCATTLSSLDAAVVTRRRHRVTSFAFPSGGAPAGASLHLRLPLRRRRPSAEYADCIYGTDCADCGLRFPRPPPICAETCNWASDADCNDCGPGSEFRPAPGRRHVYHCASSQVEYW